MSLLNSRINSIEAEVQDVASQVSVLQTTISSNNNKVANVIGDEGSGNLGFKLLDTSGNLRGITGHPPTRLRSAPRAITRPSFYRARQRSAPMATMR